MNNNYVFMADGFEEIEALATVDVMRRAGMEVTTVSINPTTEVTGAHGVKVMADTTIDTIDANEADWLILPGGMPGATNLRQCRPLCEALLQHHAREGHIAAICASPTIVLATLGLLKDREATCYPGMQNHECGVQWSDAMVVTDGHIVTGRGPAAACDFGLTIVALSCGPETADEVAEGMLLE
ncbi:MAG: DJ-1/PfpI family protein [Muribaculaceae bacterium]|nr:DJ-1/PfpI family protein [Muribaculaceae bacterium]